MTLTERSNTQMSQPSGTTPQSAELTPGPGFRIRYNDLRPAEEVTAGFRQFETPDISDLMNRLYTMNTAIRPLTGGDLRVLGPACTVKVFPGDNLMVHKALDIAQPGDVMVVDASSSTMTAVLGDTISMKARHRGIVGFVVDGVIRDLPAILRLGDFPVFARGTTPIGPLHRGPGEINHPICAGGIVVSPGDLIVGDLNGVVVVPREITGDILHRLIERASSQQDYMAAVERGEFSNAWVDRVLGSANLEIPGPAVLSTDTP